MLTLKTRHIGDMSSPSRQGNRSGQRRSPLACLIAITNERWDSGPKGMLGGGGGTSVLLEIRERGERKEKKET